MRRSGRIVRQVLETVKEVVAPGVTTMELERVAEKKIDPKPRSGRQEFLENLVNRFL